MTYKQLQIRMLRRRKMLDRFGIANTCLQDRISNGLIPPPVSLGGRAVAWPEHEIDQVLAAFVAGRTPDQIKTLVKELVAHRKLADQQEGVKS